MQDLAFYHPPTSYVRAPPIVQAFTKLPNSSQAANAPHDNMNTWVDAVNTRGNRLRSRRPRIWGNGNWWDDHLATACIGSSWQCHIHETSNKWWFTCEYWYDMGIPKMCLTKCDLCIAHFIVSIRFYFDAKRVTLLDSRWPQRARHIKSHSGSKEGRARLTDPTISHVACITTTGHCCIQAIQQYFKHNKEFWMARFINEHGKKHWHNWPLYHCKMHYQRTTYKLGFEVHAFVCSTEMRLMRDIWLQHRCIKDKVGARHKIIQVWQPILPCWQALRV